MARDNNKNDYGEERSEIEKARAILREETLPALLIAYDKIGPAAVLALSEIMADAWTATGFTVPEWRELISIYDPESVS
jgi:hypothetical protein